MWHIGQKIVCINDKPNNIGKVLMKEAVYTIEFIEQDSFKVREIPLNIGMPKYRETYFRSVRFVPADILDIELNIEELLTATK